MRKLDIRFVPLVVIIFNRPDLLDELFARIRLHAPRRLYLVADAPRKEREGEAALCAEARQRGLAAIDWPCEVIRIFADENMGLRRRVVSGLDYVFSREDAAIILEDDCYPSQAFLPFCEEAIDRFRADSRIFAITGTRLFPSFVTQGRCCISGFAHSWGWATWKDRWQQYDRNLTSLDDGRLAEAINKKFQATTDRQWWWDILQKTKVGKCDSWFYRWQASAWLANAGCLTPARNLVTNVGFDGRGTHTKGGRLSGGSMFSRLKSYRNTITDWQVGDSRLYDMLVQKWFHNKHSLLVWPDKAIRLIKTLWQ